MFKENLKRTQLQNEQTSREISDLIREFASDMEGILRVTDIGPSHVTFSKAKDPVDADDSTDEKLSILEKLAAGDAGLSAVTEGLKKLVGKVGRSVLALDWQHAPVVVAWNQKVEKLAYTVEDVRNYLRNLSNDSLFAYTLLSTDIEVKTSSRTVDSATAN